MTSHKDSSTLESISTMNGNGNGSALTKTVTMDAEMFEKLYLSPKNAVAGDLRKTFGNPTPVALMGFVVALTPLSVALMGWRGAAGGGVATGCASIWFGGVLLLIAGILEFILGNTFPFVVFMGYGAHFLTYGTTFVPSFDAVAAFTKDGSQTQEPPFLAAFGFYALSMALLSLVFLICSARTNAVFFLVFLCATIGFGTATGAFWHLSAGNLSSGVTLLVATGGSFFAAAFFGWYMFLAVMLAVMDLPGLPIGDLSTIIKGVGERKANREMGKDD